MQYWLVLPQWGGLQSGLQKSDGMVKLNSNFFRRRIETILVFGAIKCRPLRTEQVFNGYCFWSSFFCWQSL